MYIRHFFIFFSKCGARYKDSGEELKNLGEWWWGVRLLSQKRHLQPNPPTCVPFQRPTWHKERTTLKVALWPPLNAAACVHAQATQQDRVVNISSWHQERIRPLPWQHQKLMVCQNGNKHRFGRFYCCFSFLKSVCLDSTSHLTKYTLMFWQRHSSVLRAKVGKATSLESAN